MNDLGARRIDQQAIGRSGTTQHTNIQSADTQLVETQDQGRHVEEHQISQQDMFSDGYSQQTQMPNTQTTNQQSIGNRQSQQDMFGDSSMQHTLTGNTQSADRRGRASNTLSQRTQLRSTQSGIRGYPTPLESQQDIFSEGYSQRNREFTGTQQIQTPSLSPTWGSPLTLRASQGNLSSRSLSPLNEVHRGTRIPGAARVPASTTSTPAVQRTIQPETPVLRTHSGRVVRPPDRYI